MAPEIISMTPTNGIPYPRVLAKMYEITPKKRMNKTIRRILFLLLEPIALYTVIQNYYIKRRLETNFNFFFVFLSCFEEFFFCKVEHASQEIGWEHLKFGVIRQNV